MDDGIIRFPKAYVQAVPAVASEMMVHLDIVVSAGVAQKIFVLMRQPTDAAKPAAPEE